MPRETRRTCATRARALLKDGQLQSLQGEWAYVGGTGKLKGLTGKGAYKRTPAADGTVTCEVEGEYELPKK